jgi:hypothetical protein
MKGQLVAMETLQDTQSPVMLPVVHSLHRLVHDPVNSLEIEKDPVSRSMYSALLELPLESPLAQEIEYMAGFRLKAMGQTAMAEEIEIQIDNSPAPDNRPSEAKGNPSEFIGNLRTAITNFCYDSIDDFSDKDLTRSADWKRPLGILSKAIYNEDNNLESSLLVDRFARDVTTRQVSTCFPGRELMPELLFQALRHRTPHGVRIADFGSSVASGVIWQMVKDTQNMPGDKVPIQPMSFEKVTVQRDGYQDDLTVSANRLLARLPIVKEAVEIDQQLIYWEDQQNSDKNGFDEGFHRWARSSFRAKERHDEEFINHFDALLQKKPESMYFFAGRLQDDGYREQIIKQFVAPHYVVINTCIHQNKPEDQMKILQFATRWATEGVVVGEFAELNTVDETEPAPLSSITTLENWQYPGSYAHFFIDKRLGKIGLQEVARYVDNSRCSQPVIQESLLHDGKRIVRLSDLVAGA